MAQTFRVKLLRQPAGGVTARLGTNNVQGDERDDRCIPRLVTFTRDYYIGVFELTQGQSAYFWTPPTAPDGSTRDEAARLPLNMVSFGDVRGVTKGRLWPAQGETLAVAHQVDEGSLVFALRAKIGVDAFDLPTSAQWEFAYRAGSKMNHYWGSDRARSGVADEILAATNNAWTAQNASSVQIVGTRLPNAWGLYDMAGNVLEMHLDRFAQGEALSDGSDQIDPRGSANADAAFRMAAGGSYYLNAETETIPYISAVGFDKLDATARLAYLGLRLQCDARFLVDND